MNIDRVAPRVNELGLRRTDLPAQPFDLTVSDQGVRPNQGKEVVREEGPISLNSSPDLGELLSVEETHALREAFAPITQGSVREQPTGVYTIRGQTPRAAQGVAHGSLLDITG